MPWAASIRSGSAASHAQLPEAIVTEKVLSSPSLSKLRRVAQKHGVTLAAVCCAAWALVHRSLSEDDSVVFGSTSSGRAAA
eukprot:6172170-Pleurochrysis_carterae.AAC.1